MFTSFFATRQLGCPYSPVDAVKQAAPLIPDGMGKIVYQLVSSGRMVSASLATIV